MRLWLLVMYSCVSSFRIISTRFAARRWFSTNVNVITFAKESTVENAFNNAQKWLLEKNVYDSDESARHMLAEAAKLGYRRSDFNDNLKKVLSSEELELYAKFCQQRSLGVPVQYIIGNWDFYGLTFDCKPPILIPRWETEELIQNILYTNVLQNISKPRILDIGAGTGAIGIALAYELPTGSCDAIDINLVAVDLAKKNADKILGSNSRTRYNCIHSSFLDYVNSGIGNGLFDLIVSNPPYIPSDEIPRLHTEVKDHEDPVALDGGSDGLDIVRDIITHFPKLVSESGTKELWMEVSCEHPPRIRLWIDAQHSKGLLLNIEFVSQINDSCGPRFVRLRCK